MRVCPKCARYGTTFRSYVPRKTRKPRPEEEKLEVVEGFPGIIHAERERKGWKQEELAQKINEPESVVKRLESGKMHPSEKMARKLEGLLGVKLLEKVEEQKIDLSRKKSEGSTLGDLAFIKKRRR
jgi:putative transcription factor